MNTNTNNQNTNNNKNNQKDQNKKQKKKEVKEQQKQQPQQPQKQKDGKLKEQPNPENSSNSEQEQQQDQQQQLQLQQLQQQQLQQQQQHQEVTQILSQLRDLQKNQVTLLQQMNEKLEKVIQNTHIQKQATEKPQQQPQLVPQQQSQPKPVEKPQQQQPKPAQQKKQQSQSKAQPQSQPAPQQQSQPKPQQPQPQQKSQPQTQSQAKPQSQPQQPAQTQPQSKPQPQQPAQVQPQQEQKQEPKPQEPSSSQKLQEPKPQEPKPQVQPQKEQKQEPKPQEPPTSQKPQEPKPQEPSSSQKPQEPKPQEPPTLIHYPPEGLMRAPREVIKKILKYLDAKSLNRISGVNKKIHLWANIPTLWMNLAQKMGVELPRGTGMPPAWKVCYIQQSKRLLSLLEATYNADYLVSGTITETGRLRSEVHKPYYFVVEIHSFIMGDHKKLPSRFKPQNMRYRLGFIVGFCTEIEMSNRKIGDKSLFFFKFDRPYLSDNETKERNALFPKFEDKEDYWCEVYPNYPLKSEISCTSARLTMDLMKKWAKYLEMTVYTKDIFTKFSESLMVEPNPQKCVSCTAITYNRYFEKKGTREVFCANCAEEMIVNTENTFVESDPESELSDEVITKIADYVANFAYTQTQRITSPQVKIKPPKLKTLVYHLAQSLHTATYICQSNNNDKLDAIISVTISPSGRVMYWRCYGPAMMPILHKRESFSETPMIKLATSDLEWNFHGPKGCHRFEAISNGGCYGNRIGISVSVGQRRSYVYYSHTTPSVPLDYENKFNAPEGWRKLSQQWNHRCLYTDDEGLGYPKPEWK